MPFDANRVLIGVIRRGAEANRDQDSSLTEKILTKTSLLAAPAAKSEAMVKFYPGIITHAPDHRTRVMLRVAVNSPASTREKYTPLETLRPPLS